MLIALLAATPLLAEGETPFNLKEMNKFLEDFPDYARLMQEQGHAIEQSGSPETWKALQADQKMRSFLSNKGWDTQRFFYVASHVTTGVMAVQMQEKTPELGAQIEAQKAAILNNPQIPAAMKEQVLAQMQVGAAQVEAAKAAGENLPPQEMQLITSHKDRIMERLSRVE